MVGLPERGEDTVPITANLTSDLITKDTLVQSLIIQAALMNPKRKSS